MAGKSVDIDIALKNADAAKGLAEMKSALKAVKEELAGVEVGSKSFAKLSAAAGELTDNIGDLGDATKAFTGTGIEKLNASFGLLKEGFGNFDGGKFKTALKGIGAAMKAIPIFLIIEGIKFLVENFEKLSSGSGFLSKALKFVGDVIGTVIQALKDFADWLGITSFAAEEAAEKQVAASNRVAEASKKKYENEIKLAQAAGKETYEIERQKEFAARGNIMAQLAALERLKKVSGSYTDDQLKQIEELKKAYADSKVESDIIELKHKKKLGEDAKKANEDAKKAFEVNKKLIQQTTDFKIKAIEDETLRAEAQAKENFNRSKEEIKASTGNAKLKNEALIASEIAYQAELKSIQDKKAASDKAIADKKADEEKKLQEKKLEDEKAATEKAIQAQNANDKAMAEAKVLQAEADKTGIMEAKMAELQTLRDIELQDKELTDGEKLLIEEKYQASVKDLRDKARQEEMEATQEKLQIAAEGVQAVQGLSDLAFTLRQSTLKKGSDAELAAAKKQFQVNKGLQIATATIQGITGVLGALTAKSVIPEPFGQIARIVTAVSVGAAAAANIAKIKSTQFNPGSGGGGEGGTTGAAPTAGAGSNPTSAAPPAFNTPQFFGLGQGQNPNGAQKPQTIKVINVATETADVAAKVVKVDNMATQTIGK